MPVIRDIRTKDPLVSTASGFAKIIRNALAGAAAAYIRHYNDQPAEPALELWQTDTTPTAPVLWSRYTLSGVKGIEHLVSGITLRGPDGTKSLVVDNTGVRGTGLAVGLHEVDASLIMTAGAGVSNTVRTANSVALAAQSALGNVILSLPEADYEFNATVLSQALGGRTFIMQGAGFGTILRFFGTSGVLLDWAGSAAYPWRNSGMRNLTIECGSAMASGCVIRLKTCLDWKMDDVWIRSSGTIWGPWTAIQVGDPSITGITNIPIGVYLNRVKTGLISGSTGASLLIYSAAGVYTNTCDLSGQTTSATTTYGIRCLPNSTSTDNDTYGALDTLVVTATLIKDHQYGFRAGEIGLTANVQISGGGHIDGIGVGAATGYCIFLVTAAGAAVQSFTYSPAWMAQYATAGFGVYIDATTGTIAEVTVGPGKITGCTRQSLEVVGAPTDISFNNMTIEDQSIAGQNVIEVQGTTDGVAMHGCIVRGAATSGNSGVIGSSVTNFNITGNQGRGKTTGQWTNAAGTSSTSKIFANNTA